MHRISLLSKNTPRQQNFLHCSIPAFNGRSFSSKSDYRSRVFPTSDRIQKEFSQDQLKQLQKITLNRFNNLAYPPPSPRIEAHGQSCNVLFSGYSPYKCDLSNVTSAISGDPRFQLPEASIRDVLPGFDLMVLPSATSAVTLLAETIIGSHSSARIFVPKGGYFGNGTTTTQVLSNQKPAPRGALANTLRRHIIPIDFDPTGIEYIKDTLSKNYPSYLLTENPMASCQTGLEHSQDFLEQLSVINQQKNKLNILADCTQQLGRTGDKQDPFSLGRWNGIAPVASVVAGKFLTKGILAYKPELINRKEAKRILASNIYGQDCEMISEILKRLQNIDHQNDILKSTFELNKLKKNLDHIEAFEDVFVGWNQCSAMAWIHLTKTNAMICQELLAHKEIAVHATGERKENDQDIVSLRLQFPPDLARLKPDTYLHLSKGLEEAVRKIRLFLRHN